MNYSFIFFSVVTLLSFSSFSAEPSIAEVAPPNGSWLQPDGEYDKIDIAVKISGGNTDLDLFLKHKSKDYKFKKKANGNFDTSLAKELIPDVASFDGELILKEKNKEISRKKLTYFCCAMLGYGSLYNLKKGSAVQLEVKDSESPLNGIKVSIPSDAVLIDQRAVISVDRENSAPFDKYFAVSYGISFRTSSEVQQKGIVVSIPFDVSKPRLTDGTLETEISYMSKFNATWEEEKKGEILVLGQIDGTWSELKTKLVSKGSAEIVLDGKNKFNSFLVVARRLNPIDPN